MTLPVAQQKAVIARIRCESCKRAPTPAWQEEMRANFGDKIESTSEKLVWFCPKCGKSRGAVPS